MELDDRIIFLVSLSVGGVVQGQRQSQSSDLCAFLNVSFLWKKKRNVTRPMQLGVNKLLNWNELFEAIVGILHFGPNATRTISSEFLDLKIGDIIGIGSCGSVCRESWLG